MRKVDAKTQELVEVVCNACGKSLRVRKGLLLEECFYGVANFGYFGRKDKTTHQFDLCEDCYDKMTESFVVPVTEEERTELL